MSKRENSLPDYVIARINELQAEVEAKAKVMPDGHPSLEFSKDALALYIGVFHETETLGEAANQVAEIVQKARHTQ